MKQTINSITVIADDYPTKGHMEYVFVQQLVHAIINMGIKVTVVAPQSIVHNIVRRKKSLSRYTQEVTDKGIVYDVYRPYKLSFGNRRYFSRITRAFNKYIIISTINKIDNDILYSHFWHNALTVYEYASEKSKKLFVACGEGDDALEYLTNTISEDSKRHLASVVTGVISVSTENMRKCIDYKLSNKGNISVFPNCVNTTIFKKTIVVDLKKKLGIKDNDFVICFVGNFILRKGPDRIAMALSKLNDPQIKIMFIGEAYSGHAYDFECPGIIHKGSVDHDLLPLYLNCADVFVLPTQKEGCCNAIVEALAVGLPVISSDRAFNDDILNSHNSIRINPDDIDAIAHAIETIKEDNDRRNKMIEYTLSRHAEYSIDSRAEKIIDFMVKQCQKSNNC